MPNVTKRRNVYYFQRRVPNDLRHIWDKIFIRISLETTDKATANRKVAPLIVEWDQKFEQARSGQLRLHTDEELTTIAIGWLFEFKQSVDFQRYLDSVAMFEGHTDQPEPMPGEPTRPLGTTDELRESIGEYLDRNAIEIKTEVDFEALLAEAHDEHVGAFYEPRKLEPNASRKKVVTGKGPGLLETFELYLKEAQPRDRTEQEYRKSIGDFLALHGGDMPIRSVRKGMLVEYKNLLLSRPKQISADQKKLNLRDLAERVGDDVGTLSGASINKALSAISATLEYGVKNDLIEINPAAGVKVAKNKTAQKRLPYSTDDLNRIFSNPIFTARKDEKSWLPLLALFTGARLEELAQLYVSDVTEHDGIYYLNIAEIEESQTVKNQNSVRRVPIHPELIKLGFIEYVRSRNTNMVFNLRPYRGRYSHAFSKWYGRFVREKIGIMDARKVFHSYRHSFKDCGRDSGLDKAVVDALQGHSDGSVSGGYGSGYSLSALNKAMKQIKYPGLRLKLQELA